MTIQATRYCNGPCGKQESTGRYTTGWLVLDNNGPHVPADVVTLDSPHHFCSLLCLGEWVADVIAGRANALDNASIPSVETER